MQEGELEKLTKISVFKDAPAFLSLVNYSPGKVAAQISGKCIIYGHATT